MYTLILFDLEFDTVTHVGEQGQGKAQLSKALPSVSKNFCDLLYTRTWYDTPQPNFAWWQRGKLLQGGLHVYVYAEALVKNYCDI